MRSFRDNQELERPQRSHSGEITEHVQRMLNLKQEKQERNKPHPKRRLRKGSGHGFSGQILQGARKLVPNKAARRESIVRCRTLLRSVG